MAKMLDEAIQIPGTSYKIGIDALVGLIPVGGDIIGAVFSSYILFEAFRMGCSKRNILKMLGNLIVDFLVGLVPLIGDFFDIVWKANMRNIVLIEKEIFADRT